MDSYQSFGLCENALEFQVEVELPDHTFKQYQFHSRYTVDKIKTLILQDHPHLKKNLPNSCDYILTVDNERIEIDFQRFIVSHPRITEILEQEPLVKIKLIPKNEKPFISQTSSPPIVPNSPTIAAKQEQLNLNVKVADLKLSLEKSPMVSRLANGGRPKSADLIKNKREDSKFLLPEITKNRASSSTAFSSSPSLLPQITTTTTTTTTTTSTTSSSPTTSPKIDRTASVADLNKSSDSVGSTSSSGSNKEVGGFFTFGSPKIKSFFINTFDQKKRSLSHKTRSSDDLSYSSIHIGATLRPKSSQEYQQQLLIQQQLQQQQIKEDGSGVIIGSGGINNNGSPINNKNGSPNSSSSNSSRSSTELELSYIKDYSLIQPSKGFIVEPQRPNLTLPLIINQLELNTLITNESWYIKYFYGNDHWNYIGEDPKNGLIIVSILKENSNNDSSGNLSAADSNGEKKHNFKVLLRTKNSDIFTKARIKGLVSFLGNVSSKPPVKEIVQSIIPDMSFKFLKSVKSNDIQKDLKSFEERQRVKSFKFGILYCAPGQQEEEDMFSNRDGSEGFNQFLDFLGQRIKLNGWKDYRGGLDVKSDTTGTESIYEKYQGFEIMFHVATMLPHSELDKQQVDKKRHLGNDIVVIVYKEGDQLFDPKVIKSDFNHVFIVVSPVDKVNNKKYKISIVYKDGVEPSTPYLPNPSIWEQSQEFKEFLLSKLINSECASYEAPSFKIKIQRTRVALLKDMNSTYLNNSE